MTSPQSWQRVEDHETRLAVKEVADALKDVPPRAAFRAYRYAAINLTTARQVLPMDNVEYDYAGEYNANTGVWTPRYTGVYLVTAGVAFNTNQTPAGTLELMIYKNGNRERYFHYGTADVGYPQFNGADVLLVKAGDLYDVRVTAIVNPSVVVRSTDGTWFSATLLHLAP